MEDLEARSAAVGQTLALALALNAVIAFHPSRELVLAALRRQRLVGETFLLSAPIPDAAFSSFHDTLDAVTKMD